MPRTFNMNLIKHLDFQITTNTQNTEISYMTPKENNQTNLEFCMFCKTMSLHFSKIECHYKEKVGEQFYIKRDRGIKTKLMCEP